MNRQQSLSTVAFVSFLIVIVGAFEILNRKPTSPITPASTLRHLHAIAALESELYPLWTDAHTPLPEGHPPWPRGLRTEQVDILRRADRIVVARINPYGALVQDERFHRHRIYGAVAIEDSDDVAWLADHLVHIKDLDSSSCEFYPPYAIRVWSDDDVVDFLLQMSCGPDMYAITPNDQRYVITTEASFQFLKQVLQSVPEREPDVENR